MSNGKQTPKPTDLLPLPETQGAEFAVVVEAVGSVIHSMQAENAKLVKETAEINKPILEQNNKRYWDNVDGERNARISMGWRNYVLAALIVIFLLGTAGGLLYQGDKQNGMAIIGLVIGLVAGFLGGQGWEKSRTQQQPNSPPAS